MAEPSGCHLDRHGGSDAANAGRITDRLQVAALVLLGLGLAVGAVRAMQAGWIPVGDEALIEMRVRDVPAHMPLVGVYSRFGWSHPGPFQFVMLAVPYRLLGQASAALLVGALVGHMLCIAAAWWVTRQIDRVSGAAVLLAMELVLLGVPSGLVRSAWNPYVALLMAGLMVVLGWGTAERRPLAAMLLLPVGSLLVQSHVGNAPLVVLVVAVAVPLAVWTHRSVAAGQAVLPDDGAVLTADGALAMPWRWLGWGAAAAAVMWLPSLFEQLRPGGGNLSAMLGDLSGDDAHVGVRNALGVVTRAFGWWPSWTDQRSLLEPMAPTSWVVPLWALLPVAAAVVAVRRRDWPMVRGLAVGGAGLLSAVVATASIKGAFFPYLVVGTRSIVAVLTAVAFGALLRSSREQTRVIAVGLLSSAAIAAAVAIGVNQWSATNPTPDFRSTVRAATAAVQGAADGRAVHITAAPDDPSRDVASGLLLQLERAGIPATTDRSEGWRMGEHRASDGRGAMQVKIVPIDQEQSLVEEGYKVLLRFQPLSERDQAETDRLTMQRDELIAAQAAAAPGDSGAALRYAAIQDLAQRIARISGGRRSAVVGVRDR